MPTVMLDTNVIAGLLNPDDALHSHACDTVRRREDKAASFAISVITWSELRVGAVRKGVAAEKMLEAFRAAVIDRIVEVDETTAESAALLRAADLTIRVPDTLIIATARAVGADALLTADRKFPGIAPELVELLRPG
ncbi:type II toxin-antitoxin system VapC family toxin [Streptosporangium sp. NBC_01755]|uniref:type II toxin-antitoxin system VapC family toxin n=1 Tax=Streptosporangium sp. NBC_01755 TaxID=2975949 RepID=UPI002DDBAEF7|nr:type II toxin-antitoxin system VapC family toxin [Streptosporangium sp. NBC_01755]WSC98633.1 type II toxin-antitoxin system VapC family toxin [Streptosporangium sp. NBC_01755]